MGMRKVEPKTEDYYDGPVGGHKKKTPPKIYPKLRLEHKAFPEVIKWEVGKEYIVKLKLKQVGQSISKFNNEAEFEIHGFEALNSKKE